MIVFTDQEGKRISKGPWGKYMQMGLQIIAKHNGLDSWMRLPIAMQVSEEEEGVAGRDCGGLLLRK